MSLSLVPIDLARRISFEAGACRPRCRHALPAHALRLEQALVLIEADRPGGDAKGVSQFGDSVQGVADLGAVVVVMACPSSEDESYAVWLT
jgi:hypothetical protein